MVLNSLSAPIKNDIVVPPHPPLSPVSGGEGSLFFGRSKENA